LISKAQVRSMSFVHVSNGELLVLSSIVVIFVPSLNTASN
jgi:hypothetical protein